VEQGHGPELATDRTAFKLLTPEERQAQQEEFEQERRDDRDQRSKMLDELLAIESGLTNYALQFVEDMSQHRDTHGVEHWNDYLTSTQVTLLERIHSDRCG
jgi:hypothetical protein